MTPCRKALTHLSLCKERGSFPFHQIVQRQKIRLIKRLEKGPQGGLEERLQVKEGDN